MVDSTPDPEGSLTKLYKYLVTNNTNHKNYITNNITRTYIGWQEFKTKHKTPASYQEAYTTLINTLTSNNIKPTRKDTQRDMFQSYGGIKIGDAEDRNITPGDYIILFSRTGKGTCLNPDIDLCRVKYFINNGRDMHVEHYISHTDNMEINWDGPFTPTQGVSITNTKNAYPVEMDD